jgi:hypothetical protein
MCVHMHVCIYSQFSTSMAPYPYIQPTTEQNTQKNKAASILNVYTFVLSLFSN